jgi:hypothetical protein
MPSLHLIFTTIHPRYELHHDQSHRSNRTLGYPGSVLLKTALVNMQDLEEPEDWESDRKKIEMKKPYCLRCYIYQVFFYFSIDGMFYLFIFCLFCYICIFYYLLTLLLMPLAGLHFCVGLALVTPLLKSFLSKHHHHHISV